MSAHGWRAGAAATVITPTEPMWLAGWAARRQPATGKAMDLFAKAVAFEDAAGDRAVIVTADLIAIPRDLAVAVAARIGRRRNISRDRLLFNASHTHTGPEVRPDKVSFFEIPPEFASRIPPYVLELEERITAVIEVALDRLQPATLCVNQVRAGFATNRRSPAGPVDHDVPLVVVSREDGKPLALLFGYACHNLTLPPTFAEFHGDYAGVAQSILEDRFPGTAVLFLAGAGADQDPSPRGSPELSHLHGQTLADEIQKGLSREGRAISGPLRVAFAEVNLDLMPRPSREKLEEDARSDDPPRRRKASYLLAALAEKRQLATSQACPVQIFQFGSELLLVALGGEPVAEYALRFKREFAGPVVGGANQVLGDGRFADMAGTPMPRGTGIPAVGSIDRSKPDLHPVVWVAGYSNDMFGYLPTRQVQQEGGYESGRATLWSALPAPLAETTEKRVVEAVHRLVRHVRDPATSAS